jgi:hypothetical protein
MAKNGVSLKNESWRLGIGFYQINVDQIARCAHTHRRYIYIYTYMIRISYIQGVMRIVYLSKNVFCMELIFLGNVIC